jgi:hypothetical protein
MICSASNGYSGWLVRDSITNEKIEFVEWIDPDSKTYCATDFPWRAGSSGVLLNTVYRCASIIVDLPACTFWVTKAPATVAPLSPGRQQDQQPTDKPCPDCCQEETCRRLDWCAAHRCDFGAKAP